MMLLFLGTALAADDAVQVHLTDGAIVFAEETVEALDPRLVYAELSQVDASCYDLAGIRDFNLDIPIDIADIQLSEDQLVVDLQFGTIYGENMVVFAEDEDWLDACASFETDLLYLSVTNGRITAPLTLATGPAGDFDEGQLRFDWAEPPVLTGDLDMDLAWVPDDLVLWLVEDLIFQEAEALLEAELPGQLSAFLGEASYAGDYGGLVGEMALSDASLSSQTLDLYVDASVSADAAIPCEIGDPGSGAPPTLPSPRLTLGDPQGADLAVAVTEAFMGESLHAAWEAGWMCVPSETMDALVQTIAPWIDPAVVKLEGWATVDSAPGIQATADGLLLDIPDLRIEISGRIDGSRQPLATVHMDIAGLGVPGYDAALTAVTLSMVEPQLTVRDIQLDHIPNGPVVGPLIQDAIEAWATEWVAAALADVVLFDALYSSWDILARLERTESLDGGLALWFELYHSDDPEVDTEAPNTQIALTDTRKDRASFQATGTDDREGPLAYSWQVDGRGWSDWSTDDTFTATDLDEGEHTVEVIARDGWLNVDGSPATARVTVQPPADPLTECGCQSGTRGALWLWPLALLGLRARRMDRGPAVR